MPPAPGPRPEPIAERRGPELWEPQPAVPALRHLALRNPDWPSHETIAPRLLRPGRQLPGTPDGAAPRKLPWRPRPYRGIRRPTVLRPIFGVRQIYGSFLRPPAPTAILKSVPLSCALRRDV